MNNENVRYEILEKIGVICTYSTGWSKELNVVSWNDQPPKFDIRDWSEDHEKMSRGVTLHQDEMERLVVLFSDFAGRTPGGLKKSKK